MPSPCLIVSCSCSSPPTDSISQGIHNIFVVIPQFLVTGLSSLIFAILDPDKSVLHPGSTDTQAGDGAIQDAARGVLAREDGLELGQKPNSIAIIFRWVPAFSCAP